MTAPSVSVLIVNWNTRELLEQCLDSLQGAEDAGLLEIIVVDNGSSDGSPQAVHDRSQPGVTLVENSTNRGFAAAVNQADDLASAPYRLMLNSDTVVAPGTISGCLDLLRRTPRAAAVGCRLLNADGTHQNSVFRFPSLRGTTLNASFVSKLAPDSPSLNWDRYGRGDWSGVTVAEVVMGSFLLVQRDVVPVDEPLLDEGYFMHGEEADLCRRIVAAGRNVIFAPEFSVMHVRGASTRSPEQLAWAEESKRRAQLRFMRKWRPRLVPSIANLVMLFGLVPRSVGWCVADMRDRLTGKAMRNRRYRAHAAAFHLRALMRPSAMDEAWGPPPK